MASIDKYLKDPEYKNWVKSGLALNITNEVLRPFVVEEIKKLHQSIVKTLPRGVSCTGCSVDTACPNDICDEIQSAIEDKHWYPNPSFTNTCTGRWSTEPWEIAKCFMPKGYRRSAASDADFSACINVIINCKHFQAFGTSDPNGKETDLSKSRDFRNKVMHGGSQKVSEQYMKKNLDILINILKMVQTTDTEDDTNEAIGKIQKIKKDQLTIKLKDVIEVQRTATEAIADKPEKNKDQVQMERLLVNFEAGCRKALCRLTEEHIKNQEENLSVADFLSKIRILALVKDLCSRHQEMLFRTEADIREWDLFVYCFILEKLDLSEPLDNAVSTFVKEVKKIRNELLVNATGVNQNDLSELCNYLIDTDLNTEVTDIFKKDSPDVNVIRSNNILVSWWREEEDYGKKQVSKEQLYNKTQFLEEIEKCANEIEDKVYQRLTKRLLNEGVQVSLPEAHEAVKIGAEAEVRPRGCNEKLKKALQEHITNLNNDDTEKTKYLNNLGHKLNVSDPNLEEGSIILNVTCSSITNVIDFWNSCIDGRAVEALSDLRDYYRRHFNCDTLEFDVILTKKGVFRCVNKIVEDLPSRFEVLIDNVTHKVQEILEAKVETPSLSLHMESDIIAEETEKQMITEGKQIKDMNPATGPDKDSTVVKEGPDPPFKSDITSIPVSIKGKASMVVDDGSDIMVKSETPSLSLHKESDIIAEETEKQMITEGKQIKGDSVRDIDKQTREEVDRLVKILRQISEDLEGGSIASIKQHLGDIIRYSKDDDEKMIDGCNRKFLKQTLKSGTSPNLIKQAMRVFLMIRQDPSLGDLVQSEIDLIEKEQSAQADANAPVSEARRSDQFGEKSTVLIEEDIKVDEMDIHSRRLSKYQDQPSSSSSTGDPAIHFKSSGKLTDEDPISKPETRVPSPSKYGHKSDKKPKTFLTSQELSSVESVSETSKLYTKSEKKPVD